MSSDAPASRLGWRVVWCATLALALAFGCFHATRVAGYLERINRGGLEAPSLITAERAVTLGVSADGRTWLRLTEERIARGAWRFGRTWIDGGPEGRDVYWYSGWSWWLEALGRVRARWTGERLPRAIESASTWAQLPLWLGMVCAGGWWGLRRWGAGGGALLVLTLAGHRGLYVACYPGYPDHHGVIAATALGTVLALVSAMFSGPANARWRGAALVSALAGAAGLALSAASTAPVLLGLGAAGFCCRDIVRDAFGAEETRRLAARWRWWGGAGALASAGLYALEFFPDRLGWRLEVNHPVYSLAWWGGGAFLAWWWSRGGDTPRRTRDWLVPAMALLAVGAPLAAMLIGRGAVFTPLDAFVAGVHRHITEFYPLWRMSGSAPKLLLLSIAPLLLAPLAWRRLPKSGRAELLAFSILAFGLLALSVCQHRWWSLAAVAQAPLAALVGAAFLARPGGWRGGFAACLLAALALPGPVLLLLEQVRVAQAGDVQAPDAMQLLFRDLAARIAESSPDRSVVLLASPEASTGVGYHGEFKTPGTLYWENGDGLRVAARVLTATDDVAAERELRAAGVTHLLVVEPGDFTAQYLDALERAGDAPRKSGVALGLRLMEGRDVPAWARALPYAVPPQFARVRVRVALYAFEPAQTLSESRRALGVARLVAGEEAAGRANLREAAGLGSAEAALVLAWRIATSDRVSPAEADEAVRLAAGAVAVLPEAATHRRVLAACYAAARRWPEAQATILRALDLAQEAGNAAAAAELERDFARYRDFLPPAESAAPASR